EPEKSLILGLRPLAPTEFGPGIADAFCLGKGTYRGGWHRWQIQFPDLLFAAGFEGGVADELLLAQGGETSPHRRDTNPLTAAAGEDVLFVGEQGGVGLAVSGGGRGEEGELGEFFVGKSEPANEFGIELRLARESHGDVKQGAGRGEQNPVGTESVDRFFGQLQGRLQGGLPDVAAIEKHEG